MKTRLNLTKIMLSLRHCLAVSTAASAYYDPSAQRWLNAIPLRAGIRIAPVREESEGRTLETFMHSFQNDPVRLSDAFGLSIADVANMYQALVTEAH